MVWISLESYNLVGFFEILGSGCPFPYPDLVSFQPLLLWVSFLSFLSLFSFWDSHMCILVCFIRPRKSFKCSLLFHSVLFWCFWLNYFQWPVFDFIDFFFLLGLVFCSTPLVNFSVQLSCSAPWFLFGTF